MGHKKNKSNGQKQVHPQKSFQELVAEATLSKFGQYIDDQVNALGQVVLQRQTQTANRIMTRLICLEELAIELNPSITKDSLAERVSAIEDRHDGYESIGAEVVKEGDRVRIEIKTRTADQAEFQGSSRMMVDNIGAGFTLGKELEGAILGMKSGEVKDLKFGKDESLVASIALNRASRNPEKTAALEAAKAAEQAAKEATAAPEAELVPPTTETQETANASPNAG